jgi:hypothetical protein
VQEETVLGETAITTVSVTWIIDDRVTNGGHVYTDLVRSTGVQLES